MMSPSGTFAYQFRVEMSRTVQSKELNWCRGVESLSGSPGTCWSGEGAGRAFFGGGEAFVGPHPRFELFSGWLTLMPTQGWVRPLPARAFTDATPEQKAEILYPTRSQEEQDEVAAIAFASGTYDRKKHFEAMEIVSRRRAEAQQRHLASYSVFVGSALQDGVQVGDELEFSRNVSRFFGYCLRHSAETMLSAGFLPEKDQAGTAAVWQEFEEAPASSMDSDAEDEDGLDYKPYATARIGKNIFYLRPGEDIQSGPYYAHLARGSNEGVQHLGSGTSAIHSLGRLDRLEKQVIIDAARHLLSAKTVTL